MDLEMDFEPARLEQFLKTAVRGLAGPMRLERIGGGQSNPTFFVSFDNRELVLRKQPAANLLPSAQSDGRLLLQYSLSLRDLLGVSIFGTGNQQIQQPEIG